MLTPDLERRVARAAALLRQDGIVVYPTETFYGLGVLATRARAVARLLAAKLRPAGKAVPLVAADLPQVEEVASLEDPLAQRLAARFWPGPLSLVLPARRLLGEGVTGGTGTVAVRVTGCEVARALAAEAGGALVSTSANLAGGPAPAAVSELAPELVAAVDGVLDGGPTPGGLPSTVVVVDRGVVRLVRAGAVPFEEVGAVAGVSLE